MKFLGRLFAHGTLGDVAMFAMLVFWGLVILLGLWGF